MRKLLMCLAMASFAQAQALAGEVDIAVGPGGQYQHLADAVAVANSDTDPANTYVINLAPGVYLNDFPDPISRPMTIQTDPSIAPTGAVLAANVALPNQKGILLTYAPLTVRGIEITGAFIDDSLGGNGAAIRDQQGAFDLGIPTASLTLDNVLIDNNQAGVLQGDDTAEVITIMNSQFINNGNPDQCCFTHGAYINTAASLTVQGSMFCGQLIGHDIKSRAAQTIILNNQIYSAEGGPPNCQAANTSFDIDVPNGGVTMIIGNTIVQGPSAQNNKMVEYGGEGLVYANNSATFATNTFISTANSIAIEDLSYLYVTPCIPMVVAADNTFTGVSQVVYPPECEASAAPPPPSPPPPPAPPPPPPGTPPQQMHPHHHRHG